MKKFIRKIFWEKFLKKYLSKRNIFVVSYDNEFHGPIMGLVKSIKKYKQWTIDPEYVKHNFSKAYYKENSDGSIDIKLTLYFKPQSYFYLGLTISSITLLGCLVYLGWDFVKRRGKKADKVKGKEIKRIS